MPFLAVEGDCDGESSAPKMNNSQHTNAFMHHNQHATTLLDTTSMRVTQGIFQPII